MTCPYTMTRSPMCASGFFAISCHCRSLIAFAGPAGGGGGTTTFVIGAAAAVGTAGAIVTPAADRRVTSGRGELV